MRSRTSSQWNEVISGAYLKHCRASSGAPPDPPPRGRRRVHRVFPRPPRVACGPHGPGAAARGSGPRRPGKEVIVFAAPTPRDPRGNPIASESGDPHRCGLRGVALVSFSSARRGASVPPAMLLDNSEHVTGPHGPRGAIALGQRLRPTRPRGAREPRPPSGGGGATEGPQQEKPMEETAPGARETERRRERSSRGANPWRPSGRCKRERLRRQSRTEKARRGRRRRRRRRPRGTGILEGRSEPHERSSGRPGGGWRAEETVEVVQTARTERSGQAKAAVCDGASRRGRSEPARAGADVDAATLMR